MVLKCFVENFYSEECEGSINYCKYTSGSGRVYFRTYCNKHTNERYTSVKVITQNEYEAGTVLQELLSTVKISLCARQRRCPCFKKATDFMVVMDYIDEHEIIYSYCHNCLGAMKRENGIKFIRKIQEEEVVAMEVLNQ